MGVRLYDVRWVSHTAGPSPVINQFGPNCRTELFFMGCNRGANGNPCPGCFNPKLWKTIPGARELVPVEMAEHIEKFAPQKYITIVGGEPCDQMEGLVILCEELKKRDFHIIVFTHYELKQVEQDYPDLFMRFINNCDIIVDGEYKEDERIYDESLYDGFHDAVGSGNQIIWDCTEGTKKGLFARDLMGIYLGDDNVMRFITKEDTPWLLYNHEGEEE
jgi:anaerobic ribonucleoside-triphosphate reductase activating protein